MAKKSILSKKQKEYIESIIYIAAIVIIIFCKIYGTVYFSFIPLLLILGIVGKVLFKREVVTTVFGILVSLCMVYLKGELSLLGNISYSMLIGINIAMGELLGGYLVKSYRQIKKDKIKKNKLPRKSLKLYITTFGVLIVTLIVNNYTNGNIFEYKKCKESVYNYLNENYKENDKFKIMNVTFSAGLNSNYAFNILNTEDDSLSRFVIYLNNKDLVKDEYKERILAKNRNIALEELQKYMKNNNYVEKYNDITIDLKYIDTEHIELKLESKVESIDDTQKEVFSRQVVNILEDIKEYKYYGKIEEVLLNIIDVNDEKENQASNILMEGYHKCIEKNQEEPYIYILKSLSIEFIDSID